MEHGCTRGLLPYSEHSRRGFTKARMIDRGLDVSLPFAAGNARVITRQEDMRNDQLLS